MNRTKAGLFFVALVLGTTVTFTVPARSGEEAKTSVLFVGLPPVERYLKDLRGLGIHGKCRHVDREGTAYSQFTVEQMKRFHVVVVVGEPWYNTVQKSPHPAFIEFLRRLELYRQAGGGILFMPIASEYPEEFRERVVNVMLKPYDAQTVPEQIVDPEHSYRPKPPLFQFDYFWTTSITPHPLTKGIETLFFPVWASHHTTGTMPLAYGLGWQVLARGMPSAYTVPVDPAAVARTGSGMGYLTDKKGTFKSSPDIIAIRDGEGNTGRVAVVPVWPSFTFFNWHSPIVGDVVMERGDGRRKSGLARLLLNIYLWLAEPAQKRGLGGFVYELAPPPDVSAVNWTKRRPPTPMPVQWGVIGAHSSLTDGEASVAEYMNLARELGLSFVVFTEPVAQMTPQKFEQLKQACQRSSTKECMAFGGLEYEDVRGYKWADFVASAFPDAALITEQGRITEPLTYFTSTWLAHCQAETGSLLVHPWFFHHRTGYAIYTYEGGKLIDNGWGGYLDVEYNNELLIPISLTRVRSLKELRKTVSEAHIMGFWGRNPAEFGEAYRRQTHNEMWPRRVFLSQGPTIDLWKSDNPIYNPYRPFNNRWRIYVKASSESGLREVRLVNAVTRENYRRFDAGGKQSFEAVIDESGARQWYLVPVVTDVKGRTAVGPTLRTYQDGNRAWIMGDRYMAMNHILDWDEDHKYLVQFSGNAPGYHKGLLFAGESPGNPFYDQLKVVGIDGGQVHPGKIEFCPQLRTTEGKEPLRAAYRYDLKLASHDLIVTDYLGLTRQLDSVKTFDKPFAEPPRPQEGTQYADYTVRHYSFRPDYHGPFYVRQVSVEARFKGDVVLSGSMPFKLGHLYNQGGGISEDLLGIRDGGRFRYWKPAIGERMRPVRGRLDVGDYVCLGNYAGGSPAVMALTPQLRYETGGTGGWLRVYLYLGENGQRFKAGDVLRASFLTFCKAVPNSSNEWIENFREAFGLGLERPAYEAHVQRGKLMNMRYPLALEAADGSAEINLSKGELPCRLPVAVKGLNPKMPAGIYDKSRDLLRCLPVFENTAYATVDLRKGPAALFVGNLVTCDEPKLTASMVSTARGFHLEVHNPTDRLVKGRLAGAEGFAPLAGWHTNVELPPGSSRLFELDSSGKAHLRAQAW